MTSKRGVTVELGGNASMDLCWMQVLATDHGTNSLTQPPGI